MRKIIFILLGILTVGGVGYTLFRNKQKRDAQKNQKTILENVPVTVTKLNTQSVASSFSYIGTFMPNKEVAIGAETQGRIVKVFVKEGDYVKQGQVLAKVDDETLRLKLSAEEAALKNAQAALSTAQSGQITAQNGLATAQKALSNAQSALKTVQNGRQTAQNALKTAQNAKANALAMLDKAKKDVQRFENLMKADATTDMQLQNAKMGVIQAENGVNQADAAINQAEGGINQTDGSITQAENGVNQAQGAVNQAEMAVKSAQMQIEQATYGIKASETQIATTKEMLEKTNIIAPISGVITAKNFEVGSMVGGAMPLGTVTDISILKLTVMVPEADVLKFKEGQTTKVSADVYKDVAYDGTISLISAKSDNAHAYKMEISTPNNSQYPLKAGMYGKLLGKEAGNVAGIFVPRSAIVGSIQDPKVYVVNGNKAVLKVVAPGVTSNDLVQIKEGLQVGDQIITEGQINLEDGVTIKVMNTKNQ